MQRVHRAFTLIELLVVVAIIVALLAILMPSMSRAHRTAQLTVCASNLHQIGAAQLAYTSDHFGMLPPVGYWANFQAMMYILYEPAGGAAPNGFQNLGVLQKEGYIDVHSDVFFCPLQTLRYFTQSNGDPDPTYNNALPNALPQDMLAADKVKYGWTNKRGGYVRRNHGESATGSIAIRNLRPGGLLADVFSTYDRITFSHGDSLSVLYTDNHVAPQRVDPIRTPEYLLVNYATSWNPQFETIWKTFGP